MACKVDGIKLKRDKDRRVKITEEQVSEMRDLYSKYWTQKAIAEKFGCSQSAVSYIVSDVARENLRKYRQDNPPKRRTSKESREYMRDLRSYKKQIVEQEKKL